MKLRYQQDAFSHIHCLDEKDRCDPPLIGRGDTIDEARADFFEQWLNRVAMDDIKRGASAMESWDNIMRQVVGLQS